MCNYSKSVTQAETWIETFEFKNSDGTPYSLAAFTEVHLQLRKQPGSTVVAEATLTETGITKTGNQITVALEIPANISGDYKFDIDFIQADLTKWTPVWGSLRIRKQITIQEA